MTGTRLTAGGPASTLSVTTLRVPCARIGEADPVPLVDGMLEAPFKLTDDLPPQIREGASFGWPRSMHPYLMQNRYTRERVDTDLTCVVLQNQHLRATFLPELGGRLWSLFDTNANRELLYRNPVIQPANLALRNAWFAGGVEWNIGTKGHAPHTSSPLHTAWLTDNDGVPILRMWEFERLRGVVFQLDAKLAPDAHALHVYVRIQNPNDEDVPMYWWSNAAVPERSDVRVLAPATRAYATTYDGSVEILPVPVHESVDQTWPTRNTYAADYFFDLQGTRQPWVAAVDASGHGLGHASTRGLSGRKLFCWGTAPGGRRWQRWLSPAGGEYLEIQAGLASTQFEHLKMPAGATWSWVEAYGDVRADPEIAHGRNWDAAVTHLQERIDRLAPESTLADAFQQAVTTADLPPQNMILQGSGWGALEREARAAAGETWIDDTGTPFPTDSIDADQQMWRGLLITDDSKDDLPHCDPGTPPRSYVLGAIWERLLSRCRPSWARDYHLGTLAHAAGDLEAASRHYAASVEQQPTAWAYRGLARIYGEQHNHTAAAEFAKAAVAMKPDEPTLVYEAISAALDAGDAAGALHLVDTAPSPLRSSGRVQLLEAQAALAHGDSRRAAGVLDRYVVIPDLREGETSLSDIWLRLYPDLPVPPSYDFRMH